MPMIDDGTSAAPVIPRAAVSACLFRGDAVLLVKRAKPPYAGIWSLPGGRIEAGETAAAAVVREVAEETGLACTITAVAGVEDVIVREGGRIAAHYVIVVFTGWTGRGEPAAADDAAAAAFARPEDLEAYGVAARTRAIIEAARRLTTPKEGSNEP